MVMEATMVCSKESRLNASTAIHALPSWLATKTWNAFPKRADHRHSWKEKMSVQVPSEAEQAGKLRIWVCGVGVLRSMGSRLGADGTPAWRCSVGRISSFTSTVDSKAYLYSTQQSRRFA
jgi:hypothetical protein